MELVEDSIFEPEWLGGFSSAHLHKGFVDLDLEQMEWHPEGIELNIIPFLCPCVMLFGDKVLQFQIDTISQLKPAFWDLYESHLSAVRVEIDDDQENTGQIVCCLQVCNEVWILNVTEL